MSLAFEPIRVIIAAQDAAGSRVYQYGWAEVSYTADYEKGRAPRASTEVEWEPGWPQWTHAWPGDEDFGRGELPAGREGLPPAPAGTLGA